MQPSLPATINAERHLAELGIRSDPVTASIVGRALAAKPVDPDSLPRLTYDQATQLGERLARQFALLTHGTMPADDDLVWADLVQFILHTAASPR